MSAHYLAPWRVDVDIRPTVARPLTVCQPLAWNDVEEISEPACCAFALSWICQWSMAVTEPVLSATLVGA